MQINFLLFSILAGLVFLLLQGWQFSRMGYLVSKNFHHKITRGLLRSPISFFDTNPVGAILTRFSQDAHTIDASFFLTMAQIASSILKLIVQFILCVAACYLTLLPLLFLAFLCVLVVRRFHDSVVFIRNQAAMKRTKINSFYVMLNEGLPSIRATGRQGYFRRQLLKHSDAYADAVFTFYEVTSAETLALVIIGALSFPVFLGLTYAFPHYTYAPLLPGALMGMVGPI